MNSSTARCVIRGRGTQEVESSGRAEGSVLKTAQSALHGLGLSLFSAIAGKFSCEI
jgi:hypothetical protein